MKTQSIILAIVVLLAAGASAAGYSGGDGSPENPYKIATAEDMNEIGANPADWDKHFIVIADINLADYTGTQFNIIGNSTTKFTGVFDGNDHIISNFTYESNDIDYIGLFGYVDDPNAEIQDLTLINPDVNAADDSSYVGSLVGCLGYGTISVCCAEGGSVSGFWCTGGLVGGNGYGTIENCYATSEVSGVVWGIGGLVGDNNCGTISNCYASGSVEGEHRTGGLVGDNNYGTIENCYATGSVAGSSDTGGLVGYNEGGTIENCYATGSVAGSSDTGGLVGFNCDSTISNCYATGAVSGGDSTGGLVGYNGDEVLIDPELGIWEEWPGDIFDSYSTGSVEGATRVGGLVGYHKVGEVSACFWDIQSSGQSTSAGGEGKTTAQMQTESTFTDAGWDFIEIWGIAEHQTYPFLRRRPNGDLNYDGCVDFFDFAILSSHWLEGAN